MKKANTEQTVQQYLVLILRRVSAICSGVLREQPRDSPSFSADIFFYRLLSHQPKLNNRYFSIDYTSFMNKAIILLLSVFISTISFCQKIETVYLDKKDSTANMYIAVVPQNGQINSFMFLLDGFGNHLPLSRFPA